MIKKRKKSKRGGRRFSTLLILAFVGGVGIVGAFIIYTVILVKSLPSPDEFGRRQVTESSKIYDRTGKILLYEIHGEEKRTVVAFEEIPDVVKWATLVAEDAKFYSEPAFDWRAIVRAFLINIREGRISQGGSTITQQLVKNVYLTSEKTLSRKLKELILALELESRYNKDQILSFYLNQIPYGSNAYGVEAASQTYFNKSVKDVGLGEAAILAALLKAPSYYSPWGSHEKELLERKDYVLNRLVEFGYVTKEQGEKAKKEKIVFVPQSLGSIKAPHFSLAVKEYLVNRFGEEAVLNDGLKIITTLDWPLQELAEKAVQNGAERNEKNYGIKNAAMVAEDPKTGQILAMVGSKNYFDVENDGNFNVATQGLRQPGSALKPFVYMTVFEKGYSPKTMVFDVSTEFDTRGDPRTSYRPENFGGVTRGPVSFEQALGQSINIPAVKVLYLAGFDDVLKNLHNFGITTLKERWRYGLSLTLGGGEVKLIDLTNAFATLSQDGVFHNQALVLEVRNNEGAILEEYHDESKKIIDPQFPRLVTQILSDPDLRAPLFGRLLSSTVFPDYEVALKTGTSEDFRDVWAMGYTPFLTVGIWAGNNDNTPVGQAGSSVLTAVPIWNEFLKEALKKYPAETFERPEPIPLPTKPMLNGEAVFKPIIKGKTYPQIHSILFYVEKNDPLGPVPENPGLDPQFQNWEEGVLRWAASNVPNFYEYNQPVPFDVSYESNVETKNVLSIEALSPKNGEFVKAPVAVQADIKSSKGLSKIELYFNRRLVNSFDLFGQNLYRYQYFLTDAIDSQNLIEIKVFDREGVQKQETVIVFRG